MLIRLHQAPPLCWALQILWAFAKLFGLLIKQYVGGYLYMRLAVFILVLMLLAMPMANAESVTGYADAYAGGVTASGDIYDPGAFTAAAPFGSYEFGTHLLVCYEDCAEVVVNDRCGCDLDLSRAAMEAIGGWDEGRVNATVTVL
jgi:rare lipoprotein A (peptidoglycan hydrolase)